MNGVDDCKDKPLWKVAAASVKGTGHIKTGQPCQDAHSYASLLGGSLIGAVADGAGSAKHGKAGAKIAVETAVNTLKLIYENRECPQNQADWRLFFQEALKKSQLAVKTKATAMEVDLRELSTTLIMLIATPKLIAAAQVGDGAVVISKDNGNLHPLTAPQHGEYINETTFLNSPEALKNLETQLWSGKVSHLAIFSDGLQMLALKMPTGEPHPPFFNPLFHFVSGTSAETDLSNQLKSFLKSPRLRERTDDDLTLLLATLVF